MTLDELSSRIGEAWNYQRQKNWRASVDAFNKLASDAKAMGNSEETLHHMVDIYYGMGLAERGAGNKAAALEAFTKAGTLAADTFNMVARGDGTNDLTNSEDDRFMMLGAMIKQRIAELS